MNQILKFILSFQKSKIVFAFLFLATNTMLFAQKEPELTVAFLDNEKIASVNIDETAFLESINTIIEISKKEFATMAENQKLALLIVAHKSGKPTLKLYSNPKINTALETKYLSQINTLNISNTKLVDFPILLLVNSKFDETNVDFKDIDLPNQKTVTEYQKADLKTKLALNKSFAINEVLPVLAAYETIVDPKFEGVKNFGNLVTTTNFNEKQDVVKLTGNNPDYWRATMEMELGNQLIPVTKIFMLVSQGELDYAKKYIEIVSMFSKPESYANDYLLEMKQRLQLFDDQLNAEIDKGIVEHDKGEFEKAVAIYNAISEQYPNSSWANFENFYSQSELNKKTGNSELNSIENWNLKKGKVLDHNPFYGLPIGPQSAEDAYLLSRRNALPSLFKNKDQQLKDLELYADIAMDLKVYDFAAQLYWFISSYNDKKNSSLYKMLYCLEKLGVSNLKQNFKGNFEKEFKTIEKNKEKEMVNSEAFKSY